MEMNQLTITHHPHPVLPAAGRTFHIHGWKAGQSVREVLLAHGFDAHQEIVIGLDDRLLTVAEWDSVCPNPGQIINVQVAVSGGDDSNPLAIVATIALMIVAPEVALFYGLEGMAASIVTAAVVVAGNVLINAIFKPSVNDFGKANGEAASPTYSLSGGSNSSRLYEPLPIVFGTHRIFPDYGAKPFTQLSGKDQYLYQIFNFGVSSMVLSDFKIGTTDINDFSDVTFYWPDATGKISAFPGNVDTIAGAEIKRGAGWVQRTTSIDTILIAADIEGMLFWTTEKKGQLPTKAIFEIEYSVKDSGVWLPMGRFAVPVYGTHYWSRGTYQTYQTGDEYGSTYSVWVQSLAGTTNYGDHTDGETVSIPIYYRSTIIGYETQTWRWRPYSEILSNGNGSALLEAAPPQPVSYSDFSDVTVYHGLGMDTQRGSYTKSVPKGQYDVRVRLISAVYMYGGATAEIPYESSFGKVQYQFAQLRSYQEDPASYLGQQRLGLVIKASGQLNGVVQQLSALATAYCHIWNGSGWSWSPTTNPAWWYLDFARGRYDSNNKLLYGVGLADSAIDIEGIKLWATFCESQGLSFNAVVDQRQSCADVLTMIARCGLASTSWASGKLGVVWDKPNASPVMVFGMSNIARGSFVVEYLTENLADEIIVSFVDPSRDWQQQQVRCLVPGVTTPERTTTIDLMGCTNAPMAGKFANVLAAQQYYRRRTISWETDFEGFVCQRGDVVMLSHDLTQWGYSGRIVSVAGDVVTLDREVPRTSVDYLMIRQPDGTLTTYTVQAGTGDSDTLTLTTTPSIQAGVEVWDHVWTYSPLPTPGKLVKIISVSPVSESRVRIIATDEQPEFYAAWNGSWSRPSNNTLLQDETPQITRIDFSERLTMIAGVVGSFVSVSFSVDDSFDKIAGRWRIEDGPWVAFETSSQAIDIETLETGKLEVETRPFYGVLIGRLFKSSATVMGKTIPPANVTGFGISAISSQAHLTWNASQDLDVINGGYLRLRHTSDIVTPNWSSAIDIGPQVAGTATQAVLQLLRGTYLAKWVDSIGMESVAATSIITDAPDVIALNVLETLDQHTAFAGSKTNLTLTDGGLVLDSSETIDDQLDNMDDWPRLSALGGISPSGTYLFNSGLDLGSVQTSRITARQSFYGFDMLDNIDERTDVDEWLLIDGDNISDVGSNLYLRTTNDNPAGSPVWSDWRSLVVGDYSARAFEFKAEVYGNGDTHNIFITEMSVSVDMPDRIESGDDIASGAGVYSVTYTKPFMVPPAVSISAQNMATGDFYVIANKDADGFDITFKNSAGTNISRTFDFISKGY